MTGDASSQTARPERQLQDPRDLLRTIAAGTAGIIGTPFLRSLAEHLAVAFGADLAFVADRLPDKPGWAEVLASWPDNGMLPEGRVFELSGTPCELVGPTDIVNVAAGAVARWSEDSLLAAHGLDSYLALALRGADGTLLGHIGVLSQRPIEASEDELTALSIFAARGGAELERRKYESALLVREVELDASRRRVLEAGDDERQKIGRDLHDGTQQQLASLTHQLDLARLQLSRSPEDAAAMLDAAAARARDITQELRSLARGLHPSGLAERGLASALGTLSLHAAVPVDLVTLPSRRLAVELEAAVYFCVAEAVTNAAKYAAATGVEVRVEDDAERITIDIRDDGQGGAAFHPGGGLQGLRDRFDAFGGTLEIAATGTAGTMLLGVLPIHPR